jgi:hypothetical protein
VYGTLVSLWEPKTTSFSDVCVVDLGSTWATNSGNMDQCSRRSRTALIYCPVALMVHFARCCTGRAGILCNLEVAVDCPRRNWPPSPGWERSKG